MTNQKYITTIFPRGIVRVDDQNAKLRFSVGIDLNLQNTDLDPTGSDYKENVQRFFTSFQHLKKYLLAQPTAKLLFNGQLYTAEPVKLDNESFFQECNGNLNAIKELRNKLWEKLFFSPESLDSRTDDELRDHFKPIVDTNEHLSPNNKLNISEPLNSSLNFINRLRTRMAAADFNSSELMTDSGVMQNFLRMFQNVDYKLSHELENIRKTGHLNTDMVKDRRDAYYHRMYHNLQLTVREAVRANVSRGDSATSRIADVINLERNMRDIYISRYINIPDLFNLFSLVSHHPMIMRILGLTSDFEIVVPLADQHFSLCIILDDPTQNILKGDFVCSETAFDQHKAAINGRTKYAYLPRSGKNLFFQSVLKDRNNVSLHSIDHVAKEQDLHGLVQKSNVFSKNLVGESLDAFTRGIMYDYNKPADLISDAEPPVIEKDIPDIGKVQTMELKEENLSAGQRVATRYQGKETSRGWISLTQRSVRLSRNSNTVLRCGNTESCIQYDQVTHSIDEATGTDKHLPSATLFEFKGELLTLNTIFSKASKKNKVEDEIEQYENPDDPSQTQANDRLKKFLDVDYFPRKTKREISGEVIGKLFYGLPEGNSRIPSLLFNHSYEFVLYHEFRNGWGLPLHSKRNDPELSVSEIYESHNAFFGVEPFNYTNLEHHKPANVLPSRVVEDDPEETDPLVEKDALHSLVIHPNNYQNKNTYRFLLPPMISMEHAFRYGMLSRMSSESRISWKNRYNCPFKSRKEFSSANCEEGCTQYCGGLQMDPREYLDVVDGVPQKFECAYIPDPVIKGFAIKLFWDKDCRLGIPGEKVVTFEKVTESLVFSSVLELMEGPSNVVSELVERDRGDIAIRIKRGLSAYAKIYYTGETLDSSMMSDQFWVNQLDPATTSFLTPAAFVNEGLENPKNSSVVLKVTSCVRQPLIPPRILRMQSSKYTTDDDRLMRVSHVERWLNDYKRMLQNYLSNVTDDGQRIELQHRYAYVIDWNFGLGRNIVSERKEEPGDVPIGEPLAIVKLNAHFERLDARGFNDFIEEILPTGALELWFRKEEFIDDEENLVARSGEDETFSHHPEKPVFSFMRDSRSTDFPFVFDHNIQFNQSILSQLKRPVAAQVVDAEGEADLKIERTRDPFRDVISEMTIELNTHTTKFEIREYRLINFSKYRGFFTNGKVEDTFDFARESKPFKVLILNNQKPKKPEIAFTMITIQEDRVVHGRNIESSQKGNILTIYLKRGRLSSGRDERVGIVLNTGGPYSEIFKKERKLSVAGRDIVSDRTCLSSHILEYSDAIKNVVIPADKDNHYGAALDDVCGIIHYLPKFDADRQLWKFDIEFDLRYDDSADRQSIHNPFINLSLIHYQPFSVNYAQVDPQEISDLNNDCRISEIESIWCYLLPERRISVFFDRPNFLVDKWGSVKLTVSFDSESLHHFQETDATWIVRTNFILAVEGSLDRKTWHPMMSRLRNADGTTTWNLMHPLLNKRQFTDRKKDETASIELMFTKHSNPNFETNPNAGDKSIRFRHFRLRFMEIEWFVAKEWEELGIDLQTEILDNEDVRVRYMDLIE